MFLVFDYVEMEAALQGDQSAIKGGLRFYLGDTLADFIPLVKFCLQILSGG